jgi:hypothetical protein
MCFLRIGCCGECLDFLDRRRRGVRAIKIKREWMLVLAISAWIEEVCLFISCSSVERRFIAISLAVERSCSDWKKTWLGVRFGEWKVFWRLDVICAMCW